MNFVLELFVSNLKPIAAIKRSIEWWIANQYIKSKLNSC